MPNKIGKPTDQRLAILKNQVSYLLWNGKIETTYDRGKEVSRMADKIITLAINTYEDTVKVTKTKIDAKGKATEVEVINDGAKKLNARRKIMNLVYDLQEVKGEEETEEQFKARTKVIAHPLIEKIFNELAPKYATRAKDLNQKGGYTRVLKAGPRRGDAAEVAFVELV